MTKSQTISNNKIIIHLLLVITIIITVLFAYHLRAKKAPSATISPDLGLIFPVARDIKPFDLVGMDQKKFTLQNFYHHWTLLFFGFTHCSSICPTTLEVINRAYAQMQKAYPNLQVILISLDPERDSLDALAKYTRSFNPDFIGVTGKIQELRKLQSQLGIFSSRENAVIPAESGAQNLSQSNNYQIQHTSSILLINPQGKWVGLFKYGLNPKQLNSAFMTATSRTEGSS